MRQHATPLLLGAGAVTPLMPLALGSGPEQISEAALQQLIHDHPACLPIAEVDPLFVNPVPICTELNTTAGPIDNLLVTASGLPVLVECKLWRNPQARREVVGQLLDYAKELSRWSSSDLQREASRRTGRAGNMVLDLVRAAGHDVDEADFNDALTLNLRRGRFLLLIVGDGIREGVEAIAEYLQVHAGLHFTLGLVELPIFMLPGGERLVVPRVLAKTTLIGREVVAVPDGFVVVDASSIETAREDGVDPDQAAYRGFLQEMVDGLVLDDPEQPIPRVTPAGYLSLYLPAPQSSCWISVLSRQNPRRLGIRLTSNAGTIGETAIRQVVEGWADIVEELGPSAELHDMGGGRFRVQEFVHVNPEAGGAERQRALDWLRRRINDYVTAFRPRIKDAVATLTEA